MVSHLSSFSIVEADEAAVGTQFQALSIDNIRKNEDYIAPFKDAQHVIQKGPSKVYGKVINPLVNKNRTGLGFPMKKELVKPKSSLSKYQDIFHSVGYLHQTNPKINDILEDES